MPALAPYVRQGLADGERCIYIADDQTVGEVARALEADGIDVTKESERGALVLWTRKDWRQPGDLDSDRKAAQVREFVDAAFAAGFKGIRFAVEMTWTLGPDIGPERLKHWEATINRIFIPGFPGRIICQYSRSRLSPAVVETSLCTHPLAIIGSQVYPNPFYEAPLILDGSSEADRLDWKLSQLKKAQEDERERLSQRESARSGALRRIHWLNDQVNRAEPLEEIYTASLDILLQSARADRAAILLIDEDGVMRFKASCGLSEGYRQAVEGHAPWSADTPDPQPVVFPNVDHAPLDPHLREVVRREGIGALGFFPLVYRKRLLGKFMVYYNAPHPFLEEEVQLAQTIAGHIALSIQSKRSEEALRRSEQNLADFFENGATALHWVGPDGRILRANRAEMEMLGYRPEEYIGRHIADFHADREVIEDILQRLGRGETLHNYEARLRRKDGTIRHVSINSNVLWDEGKFIHTRCFTRDITERKEMEEALKRKSAEAEEASRLKSQLVSNVSHELRTPLNAILGYAHLVLGEIYGPLGGDQKSALEGVVRNADVLLDLINNLLDFSKIESGKLPVERGPVEIPRLLEEILSELKPLLEKGSLYARHDNRPLPTLYSDANKVRQILVNLLSNAIKFTARGGITVQTADRPERGGVEIRIQDTGIGIKPEDVPRIFEAFHQIDGTATRKFEGSGLGLTIVKQLIDLLKGEIRVESEFGRGSTFIVFLPYGAD